ncbi:mannose-6-phosphate isomerase, class I [Vibrio sonorensis]|uniref:mannose-6-phosphate isomerase, class I n=1 Tax=Vibrio sonorensis TaxID=1004316 RepID=UPI0008DAEA66|nr:mannose-6-phosphate isomerase, class I [Vibrio sonorensis]
MSEQYNKTCLLPMHNVIQDYAWGSRTSVSQLFGFANDNQQPQAEVWMGAHPNGCSHVEVAGESLLLSDFIAYDPQKVLANAYHAFGELPYLFKILAAEKALSIQVHPSKTQAEEGFAREEKAGIELKAFDRNYKDPNHKPELVYALTSYQAMNGFRNFEEIITLFKKLNSRALAPLVTQFQASPDSAGLEQFFSALLSLEQQVRKTAVDELLDFASRNTDEEIWRLILELAEQYPGDIGLFCPLMLNVLTLNPGEAMYLDAQTPHAYIKGTGLEIMANSDNVLRAGLTPKYMDVKELVKCTRFEPKLFDSLLITPEVHNNVQSYFVPIKDFKFSVINGAQSLHIDSTSADILLAIDSDVLISHKNGEQLTISKGQSVFIPAYADGYLVSSEGRVARAYY